MTNTCIIRIKKVVLRFKIVPGLMSVHLILLAKFDRKWMHIRNFNDMLIVECAGSQFICEALKGREYKGRRFITQSI